MLDWWYGLTTSPITSPSESNERTFSFQRDDGSSVQVEDLQNQNIDRKCGNCGKEVPKGQGYKDTFNGDRLTCLDCVCDEECK